METWLLLTIGLLLVVAFFSAFWVLQYAIDNSAVVDVGWGFGVALPGLFFCWQTEGNPARRIIAGSLLLIWATRLGWHLYRRWKSHPEDKRYASLKKEWGDQAQWRMFRFYQMQGLGAFLFALPLFLVGSIEASLFWLDYAAIGVWLIAIGGEALADYQLHEFKEDPNHEGEVCRDGLWRYSRHPNYFFEWLHWWTYVLLAWLHPWGWLSLLAPLAMWYFLTRVTGVPLAEKHSLESRGEKYRRYQQTTNAFFPWFPKSTAEAA